MRVQLAKFEDLKPYKKTSRVEVTYNIVRTGIEVYPLLGILGTILALGLGLQGTSASSVVVEPVQSGITQEAENNAGTDIAHVDTDAKEAAEKASKIIDNFGSAIWSTAAGLLCGIAFMLWNSAIELKFDRLATHRHNVSEVIMWAGKMLERREGDATA